MQAIKKRFGIIGVGGYIAPRHLRAIYDNGGELMCALDKHDCVGVLDRYFPNAEFFTNEAEFIEYMRANRLDFLSICTPNFLHCSHIALALELGASAICEKPLVLHTSELATLQALESTLSKQAQIARVYGILQLRLHPQIQALKAQVEDELMHNPKHIYKLSLRYISARGKWYHKSWKGDVQKSGGIVCNIGVHLFDMLAFVFGDFVGNELAHYEARRASGVAHFAHAQVEWLLSICASDLAHSSHNQALRILKEDSRALPSARPALRIDFSQGFEDLHTASYNEILQGRGFSLSAQKQAITIIESITKQALS
ncbi:Gfo/Idh/MocA family protein [Helicobacter canis]|uniref:Gfo/Idh/MocA family oxidoreductase n=1 Tax=Helicobacter canis TaxID=29419 RepID=UPI0026EFE0D2|nr:Gfo/Idh/MocA family oxidoreductase [Helicobacter canis]